MKEKNKNEKTVAIELEDAAAEQFLKDVEVMKSKAGKVQNPELAEAIRENCEAILEAVETDGFWSQSKKSLMAFWTRAKDGVGALHDWMVNTVRYAVRGVIGTLNFAVNLLAKIFKGMVGFITGTLEVLFGYVPEEETASIAQAA